MDQLTQATSATDTSRVVAETFTQVAAEQSVRLGRLDADTRLLDLGLDSLCLAVIVVRLEIRLGKDPFSDGEDVALPTTFGDFVGLYVNG